MKEKIFSISVLGKKSVKLEKDSNFYTTDTDAWLTIKLTDGELNPDEAIITLYNIYDKSVVNEYVEVKDQEINYHVRPEIIEHAGNWVVQLILIEGDKEYTSAQISFKVAGHILDDSEPRLEIIENWNTFMQYARDFIRDIEGDLHELPTYQKRIEDLEENDANLTAQLAQTDYEARRKKDLEDLTPRTLAAIEGGEGTSFNLLSIPQNDSVTPEKIQDESIRLDKINKETKELIGIVDGYGVVKYNEIGIDEEPTITPGNNITRIVFPSVEKSGYVKRIKAFALNADTFVIKTFKKLENGQYKTLVRYPIYLNAGQNDVKVDIRINEGEYIGYYCKDSVIMASSKSGFYIAYAQGDVDEGTFTTTPQRVLLEADIEYLTKFEKVDAHIEPTEIKGIGKVEPSVNLFDKEAVIPGGFFSPTTGEWRSDSRYSCSDFIPVEVGDYKKTSTLSFVRWDENKEFISGGASTNTVSVTSNQVKYVTFAVRTSLIDSFMFTKLGEYPEEYVPYSPSKFIFNEEWDLPNSNTESVNYNRIDPNMKPLYIKTSDGYNQPYHPSVLYIEQGFNGYKWWMVETPYPQYSQSYKDRYEVPHIHCSKDGVNWEEPVGLKNPIDDLTPEQIGTRSYMSDPHLVYREDLGRLEAWYRITDRGLHYEDYSLPTFVIRKTSIDGVNWSEREIMIDLQEPETNGVGDMVRSPALWFEDDVYRMWFVDKVAGQGPRRVVYAESDDGFTWKNRTECDLKNNPTQWSNIWHIDVFYHDGLYHLLNHPNATAAQEQLDYYVSEDGINFDFVKTVVEQSNVDNSFYKDGLYRSCLAHDGQEFYLYFCGDDDANKISRIGLLKGETLENLYSVDGGQEEGYVEFTNGIAIHNDVIRNDSYIELTTKGTRIGVEYDTERVFVEKSDGTKIYLND